MTMDWSSLAAGVGLGAVLGAGTAWQIRGKVERQSELRALTRHYGSLGGQYLVYRVREDGSEEPTGGIIELAWQPKQGLLEASAFQANGYPEWHSYLRMSREYPGSGIGHYNNSNSIHGGVQQVIYSKQTRTFHVTGMKNARREFAHCWKPKP